ncbi:MULTISPECIES: helix-turn-helix domain-containing protein [unclassified Mycolicibacterium]|uniref:helix-turn-helix domain-containing protein n=1 Tax=unclassified Mycolicibacterium TaxID=2636767 RepID=UPI0012DBD05A|nr:MULTISPECIES: cupin domain-containing protein [unclassified Mycolicibacterium]MUL80675.1 cupin domain-containing protein [Mycolicibacterium sp. CBMA 329]MUL86442.1 cupin domain-containing protein [Mycolicibacterium sp. CBMA 331]MUM01304.1 cupin domain-containing protein [Mycolicibacterium sp. CBMA 334]MUM29040.1 cupin domain-containing protein [Mycolicibacterium sp. CBMA 295]MUM36738.1 cupin domain-containing protein [Mycolicibacterium sp. CBMA 247]
MTSSRSGTPAGKRNAAPGASSGSTPSGKTRKSRTASTAAKTNRGAVQDSTAGPERGVGGAEQTMLLVGARIRAMRLRQELTLRDIAERTGVSVSMLSMLERGMSTASVGTLVAVASALGVHMYDLFAHRDTAGGSPVTRLSDQTVVQMGEGTTRRVAHNDMAAGLELAVNEYEPGGASGPSATRHDGREFGVLMTGQLTIELEDQVHVLNPGDVIAYSSDRPHRIANPGGERAVAVWVNLDQS